MRSLRQQSCVSSCRCLPTFTFGDDKTRLDPDSAFAPVLSWSSWTNLKQTFWFCHMLMLEKWSPSTRGIIVWVFLWPGVSLASVKCCNSRHALWLQVWANRMMTEWKERRSCSDAGFNNSRVISRLLLGAMRWIYNPTNKGELIRVLNLTLSGNQVPAYTNQIRSRKFMFSKQPI